MTSEQSSGRLRSLDGLRGWAALAVLVQHTLLTFPNWWDAHQGTGHSSHLLLALTRSPLHVFWAGDQAVVVFFVLSGMVLPFAVSRRPENHWRRYYGARLLRIYLPVWGAVLLGTILTVALVRHATLPSNSLLTASKPSLTPRTFFEDSTLLAQAGGLVAPLWSLRWEMWFSLLLPLYLFVAARSAKWPWPTFAALTAATIVLAFAPVSIVQQAWYLLPFAAGVLLNAHWDALRERTRPWAPRMWALLLVAALVLLTLPWTLMNLNSSNKLLTGIGDAGMLAGATLCVVIAGRWRPARRALTAPLSAHLGRLSFSLYLVHWPVIVASYILFAPSLGGPSLAVGMAVTAVIVAELFYRVIERPALLASRRVGTALGRMKAPEPIRT